MKYIRFILPLFFIITAVSCIRDGEIDCDDTGTPLFFSYLGDLNTEIFPEKINEVSMYVYDNADVLVETIILNKADLNRLQGTYLNLENGDYHIVCWGNVLSKTQVEDSLSLRSAMIAAPQYFEKELITTNDSLYFGSRDIRLSDNNPRPDTVYFNSSHIKMLVKLVGLDAAEESSIEVEVDNLSAYANFDEQYSSITTSYYPTIALDQSSGNYNARFNVLRFNDDNAVLIKLKYKPTGEVIYTLNLKDFMAGNNITVNGINEAFVGVAFTFNGLGVTVSPWNEEIITPGN